MCSVVALSVLFMVSVLEMTFVLLTILLLALDANVVWFNCTYQNNEGKKVHVTINFSCYFHLSMIVYTFSYLYIYSTSVNKNGLLV